MNETISKIEAILSSKPRNGSSLRWVRFYLAKLTVAQINQFRKTKGIKASGTKETLIQKVAERLEFRGVLVKVEKEVEVPVPSVVPPVTEKVDRIKGFEKTRGFSWLVVLLNAVNHGFDGVMYNTPILHKFYMLRDGKLWGKRLDAILKDVYFGMDFGTMSQDRLMKLVNSIRVTSDKEIPMVSEYLAA